MTTEPSITQPATITATYQTQYYLNITSAHGSPTQASQWVSAASSITVSVTSPDGDTGHRRICTGYSIDNSAPTAGTSYPFTNMQDSHIITFNWQEQYCLTVNSPYSSPSGAGWYDAGSTANIAITQTITSGTNTRSVFTSWTGSGIGAYTGIATTQSISMNTPITETASWKTQCFVTYDATGNALTVTVPSNEWVNYGTAAKGTFTTTITNLENDTRCIFTKDNRPSTITQPTQITATYQTQYAVNFSQNGVESDAVGTVLTMLGIAKDYSQLANLTWVNKGADVTFSFADTVASTVANKLCALTGVNATSPVTIDMPTLIQGNYEAQYSLYTIAEAALLIFALLLLLLLLLAWRRRRKKKQKQKATQTPPQTANKGTQ